MRIVTEFEATGALPKLISAVPFIGLSSLVTLLVVM